MTRPIIKHPTLRVEMTPDGPCEGTGVVAEGFTHSFIVTAYTCAPGEPEETQYKVRFQSLCGHVEFCGNAHEDDETAWTSVMDLMRETSPVLYERVRQAEAEADAAEEYRRKRDAEVGI